MSLVARLIDAGTPSGLVEEVAMLLAEKRVAEKAIAERRERDAERQARKREREAGHVMSRDVTGQGVTGEDDPALSPAPNENNSNPHPHTHPDNTIPRAREADPFPMPEFTTPQIWRDLKANRKAKHLPCTPTAHAKLLRDLDKLTDDEWPPGRLLEAIVARGWAAAYDPREETTNGQARQRPAFASKSTRNAAQTAIANLARTGNG